MRPVPPRLLKKLNAKGIVPGAKCSCAHGDGPERVLPPTAQWYMFSEHVHVGGSPDICLWGPKYTEHPEIFATVIEPYSHGG